MKDTFIKLALIAILLNIMCLLLFFCGCTAPREIYTRELQLYTHTGDTSAVMYHGNKFYLYRDTVTRLNEFGDTFSYARDSVRIQQGQVIISDHVGKTIYRP